MKRVYSRRRYIGAKKEPGKYIEVNRKLQERIQRRRN